MEQVKRTPLSARELPDYTRGEEIFNMASHIVGGAFAMAALAICVVIAARRGSVAAVLTAVAYGVCMLLLYTMSSVYHGLRPPMAKKVFQVIDHCTIYFMIAGTYTPICVCAIAKRYPAAGWTVFGVVWGLTALAVTFTAIDLRKYRVFSMICYLGMGWCIVFALKPTYESLPGPGFWLLVAGGLLYTVGAALYGIGSKRRWFHSVFHLFVLAGSVCHFLTIALYVL